MRRVAALAVVDWSAGGVGELNRFGISGPRHEVGYGQNERYWQSDTSSPRVSIVYGTQFRAPRATPAQFEQVELVGARGAIIFACPER